MLMPKSFLKKLLTSIVFIATFGFATTLHVATTGSDATGDGSVENPFATIQHGIDASSNSDTVLVSAGTYEENSINYWGKNIVLKSIDGYENTIIDAQESGNVIIFEYGEGSTAILDGFTLTNGNAPNNGGGGIAIYEQSSPTLKNLLIENNNAEFGGGIHITISSPVLNNIIIKNNTASQYGGGINIISSTVNITQSEISNNTTTNSGSSISCF